MYKPPKLVTQKTLCEIAPPNISPPPVLVLGKLPSNTKCVLWLIVKQSVLAPFLAILHCMLGLQKGLPLGLATSVIIWCKYWS